MDIKLTDVERLILANQYEILGRLDDDEDLLLQANNLRDGYKYFYGEFISNTLSENLSEETSGFVIAVLALYDDLKFSYEQLDDKGGIKACDVEFQGFDGNNEYGHKAFVEALLKNGRFKHVIGQESKNSHCPMIDIYQRMLECRGSLGDIVAPYDLETIKKILGAQIHPDNR